MSADVNHAPGGRRNLDHGAGGRSVVLVGQRNRSAPQSVTTARIDNRIGERHGTEAALLIARPGHKVRTLGGAAQVDIPTLETPKEGIGVSVIVTRCLRIGEGVPTTGEAEIIS